jgi:hypothetical protein
MGDPRVTVAIAAGDDGMQQATDAADPRLVLALDKAIAEANASGEVWSSNTIRDRFPTVSPKVLGARIKAASMRSPQEMVAVGRERSTLLSTHGAFVTQWRGVTS